MDTKLLELVSTKIEPTGFCWLWTGKPTKDGYGSQGVSGKTWSAHRLIYTLLVGEVPEGLDLDHLCRVRICVNPDHIEPVTRQENLRRSRNIGKGDPWKHRRAGVGLPPKKAGHCVHGHHLETVGTRAKRASNGAVYHSCAECSRIRMTAQRRAKGLPERNMKSKLDATELLTVG